MLNRCLASSPMPQVRAKWLRLSEETNALDYFEKSQMFLEMTMHDTRAWKWVVLCLHMALYGWAICALRGTNPDRVTYTTKSGREKLISFPEAISRCQDKRHMTMTINSKVLFLSKSQQESIRLLKQVFRDKFEHFIPKGWSIETHGFPAMAIDILEVIRFLALDSGNYIHLRPIEERKLRSLIYQSKRIIKKMSLYKESLININQRLRHRPNPALKRSMSD
jgi:hypothetical protein